MSEPAAAFDDGRWTALLQRADEAIFVLNQRRRIVFVTPVWETVALTTFADARSLTCTTRETGHALATLGRALAPPDAVLHGQLATVRRPIPGRDIGPPWWDIDFMPVMHEGEAVVIVGRLRSTAAASPGDAAAMPASWAQLRQQVQQRYPMSLWESAIPAVRRMLVQARLVASTGCAAALVGEPGTGKRTLARAIHASSPRKEQPFIGLACDRLPPDVVRAVAEHETEKKGVIYLHAPASLPRDVQAELARHLALRTHVLLGCQTEPAADLREGRLTEELWAAAATMVVAIAPLRLRLADLPRLAEGMLRRNADATGRAACGLTPAAFELLSAHPWPNNLDELDDVLRTAAARCDQPSVDVGDLPLALREPHEPATQRESPPPLDKLLEQVEERMIRLALEKAHGNKTKAAESLGIWRPRLIRRMEALGIADTGD